MRLGEPCMAGSGCGTASCQRHVLGAMVAVLRGLLLTQESIGVTPVASFSCQHLLSAPEASICTVACNRNPTTSAYF